MTVMPIGSLTGVTRAGEISREDRSGKVACTAPAVSMYFQIDGSVLACCHNHMHPLGSIQRDTIDAIWRGDAARTLRRRLNDGDLSLGCHGCAFEIDSGNRAGSTAATFDRFEVSDWPRRLEFALSNRCNLACIMCTGELSSRIRREREARAPLPSRYDDRFFEQLPPYLERIEQARFYGGEPFLVPEYERIWSMMGELGVGPECNVTTNGTVRTKRVEALLELLPFSIGVSVDGATARTVERIRQGVDHEALRRNIDWFRGYCADTGTWFGLTYCLMTENWQELLDFLAYADGIDAGVAVNRVVQPVRFSLFHLPPGRLDEVLSGLEAQDAEARRRLDRNRSVWSAELAVLRQHRSAMSDIDSDRIERAGRAIDAVLSRSPFAHTDAVIGAVAEVADGEVFTLHADGHDIVVRSLAEQYLGLDAAELIGLPVSQVVQRLGAVLGEGVRMMGDGSVPGAVGRVIGFGVDPDTTDLLVVTATPGANEAEGGSVLVAARLTIDPAGQPVSIGS